MAAAAPDGLVAVDMGGSFLKCAVVVAAEEDHATLERTFSRLPMSDTAERLLRLYALALEPTPDYSVLRSIGPAPAKSRVLHLVLREHWQVAA